MWLQTRFKVALPIVFGRWGSFIPHKVDLHMEVISSFIGCLV
jgi:hypothetical protein